MRHNLHVVLCLSPVGPGLRAALRSFPALLACASFDWFHPWPVGALTSVATPFMVGVPGLGEGQAADAAAFCVAAHGAAVDACRRCGWLCVCLGTWR